MKPLKVRSASAQTSRLERRDGAYAHKGCLEGLASWIQKRMNITNAESLNRLEVSVDGGLAVLRYQIEHDTICASRPGASRSPRSWRC